MKFARHLFYVLWPLLLAMTIEIIAIWVGSLVRSSFDSSTLAEQNCRATPSQWPTLPIIIIGIVTAIIGMARIFKVAKRWPYIVSGVVILLIVIMGSFIAYLSLNLLAGWCF